MATGGSGEGPGGEDFDPFRRRALSQREQQELSQNDIGNQARYLLTHFINDRMASNGIPNTPAANDLAMPGTPAGPPVEQIQQVAAAFRKIGDELDGDHHLQSLISQIPNENPQDSFLKVAREIFADGQFNWGRVVMLFYFAYKMAIRAVQNMEGLQIIRHIIELVVHFITDRLASWILSRGGWAAIQEYFGTPGWQAIGVGLTGIICAFIVYFKPS